MGYDYSRKLVGLGVQFHCFKVGIKVEVGEVALELLPTSEDILGSNIPKAMPGSRGAIPRAVATLLKIQLTGRDKGDKE